MKNSSPLQKNKWYSLSELVRFGKKGYLPVKSRSFWMHLIDRKEIPFFRKGNIYMVQGSIILNYLTRGGNLLTERNEQTTPTTTTPGERIIGSVPEIFKESKKSRKTAVLTPL